MVYFNALYNWVVFHPLYNPTNQVFSIDLGGSQPPQVGPWLGWSAVGLVGNILPLNSAWNPKSHPWNPLEPRKQKHLPNLPFFCWVPTVGFCFRAGKQNTCHLGRNLPVGLYQTWWKKCLLVEGWIFACWSERWIWPTKTWRILGDRLIP